MATATATRRKPRTPLTPMACPDPNVQPVLTVIEAGRVLGLRSRASAYKAAHTGDIPVIRVGKRLMVPTADLRKMLGLS